MKGRDNPEDKQNRRPDNLSLPILGFQIFCTITLESKI